MYCRRTWWQRLPKAALPRRRRMSSGLTGIRFEGDEFAAECHINYVAKCLLPGQTKRLDVRSLSILRNKQYLECAGLASNQNDLTLLGNEPFDVHRHSLSPCHYRMDQLGNAPIEKVQCQLALGAPLRPILCCSLQYCRIRESTDTPTYCLVFVG